MIDNDIQELARWQTTPEGNAYLSVRELDNAITSLEELSLTRDGSKFVRSEIRNIQAAINRLRDVVANIQPVFVEVS